MSVFGAADMAFSAANVRFDPKRTSALTLIWDGRDAPYVKFGVYGPKGNWTSADKSEESHCKRDAPRLTPAFAFQQLKTA